MRLTLPEKMVAIGVAPGWLAVALVGFVAYHDGSYMKFFLAMNFLMLAYSLAVLSMWIRKKLKKQEN